MAHDNGDSNIHAGSARDLGTRLKKKIYPPNVKGWALIVGISKYKHDAWDLEYAHRDAETFADLIGTATGGKFTNVRLLVNEQATSAALNRALKSFLKGPDQDDIVLLYFACHGTPDPDRPGNIYLLTHDTEPDDISGTGLPMREIDYAVKTTLRAERVVILADTCHSGGIGVGGRRKGGDESAVVNKYLNDLSEARPGVALLTSAAANETSREGKQWGGGHGVFTHFLLEGMRGQADGYGGKPRDGKVGVRELFEYVRDMVKRETKDGQHPVIGPEAFDPELPMAITGEIDAKQLYELAQQLEHLADLLDEPSRYRAATAHYRDAFEFAAKADRTYVEAEVGLARCLTRAGDLQAAERVVRRVIEREKNDAPAEAFFWLGIIGAMQRDRKAAAEALKTFAELKPDDEMAPWASHYASPTHGTQSGQRFAVLIGIDKYASNNVPALSGCVNDAQFIRHVLQERFGLPANNTLVLLDSHATRDSILRTLADLSQQATPEDQVLVTYSGHSVPESFPTAFGLPVREGLYLVVHDTRPEGQYLDHGIMAGELHAAMKAIPAVNKVLVLDTHPNNHFNVLAENDGDYEVLLASDLAEVTEEVPVTIDGIEQRAGRFTTALTTDLRRADPESVTCGDLLDRAIARMKEEESRQTPLLIGDRRTPFFAADDAFLQAFQFAGRRKYIDLPTHVVQRRYRKYTERLDFAFPSMHCSFGRAFIEKELFEDAAKAVTTALAQMPRYPEALLGLVRAQLATGAYEDVQETLQRTEQQLPPLQASRANHAYRSAAGLAEGRRYALLVGLSRYASPEAGTAEGAVDDVRAMRQILVERLGFQGDDISVLLDGDATRRAVLDHLSVLAQKARRDPALFFFAGSGSLSLEITPTIVCFDSRLEGGSDIEVPELNKRCREAGNLVTILDCSWNGKDRWIAVDSRAQPRTRGVTSFALKTVRTMLTEKLAQMPDSIAVGALTIAARDALPVVSRDGGAELMAEQRYQPTPFTLDGSVVRGKLAASLIDGLLEAPPGRLTYRQWFNAAKPDTNSDDAFLVNGDILDEPLFESVSLRREVLDQARSIEEAPLDELIAGLLRVIEQRQKLGDTYPRGRLDLGIAYSVKGDFPNAIELLDRAVALYSDCTIMTQERARDPLADASFHEARFQLGRVLYKSSRDLGRAVSELELVLKKDPDSPAALYYYGQAIRAMVERETLTEAQKALRRYLEKGAPLGHEDEVRQFLGSREVLR